MPVVTVVYAVMTSPAQHQHVVLTRTVLSSVTECVDQTDSVPTQVSVVMMLTVVTVVFVVMTSPAQHQHVVQ